ncbi:DUF4339 domain-containing protein [Thalassoglobus polymorphus]|uniref:GYF domain-containing protein n=1 Tax=Thalassoglobus polymorphus TaxID=2527994 RepID=A0A517QP40_9PLAN|nr:DUF4339 domain-containing protein [Thalassoglobus polymorphus]QDT33347.1 hypothetical protein Mal48_26000 [Thalassoglobus polymorphus]
MAVEYHYRLNGEIHGPITFRELVMHVREENLSTDDLVKADWDSQWIPAAAVVGLFHLAGRDDVLAIWEAEQQERQASIAVVGTNEDPTQAASPEVGRFPRIPGSLDRSQILNTFEDDRDDFDLTREIANVAAEALNERSFKPKSLRRKIADASRSLFSTAVLYRWFRFGSAIVSANLAGILIVNWSIANMQRFPKPGQSQTFPHEFPFWGECTPILFITLLVDTMLLTGFLGYWAARGVELILDD